MSCWRLDCDQDKFSCRILVFISNKTINTFAEPYHLQLSLAAYLPCSVHALYNSVRFTYGLKSIVLGIQTLAAYIRGRHTFRRIRYSNNTFFTNWAIIHVNKKHSQSNIWYCCVTLSLCFVHMSESSFGYRNLWIETLKLRSTGTY